MAEAEPKTFADLGVTEAMAKTLADLGYEAPTPIQERTIPLLLSGRDVIGQAQTGTGKTAAFALPILQKLDLESRDTQALVLTPTRELAMQVADAIHSYSKGMQQVSVLPIYGGAPIVPQLRRLERGAHVVVGTPGRVIDHLERKSLDLTKIRLFVLDEADEMLRMGFIDDVERILSEAPPERQVALFSATMPEEIRRIAERHLKKPAKVEIEHPTLTVSAIEQRFLNVSESQKLEVLTQILELEPSEAVLIFRRTKNGAAELAEKLEGRGFAAAALHGDMTQGFRESVVRRLRAGQIDVLVATDVAARGLDVEQIAHVVNYDIPNDVEAYVHRIGRTGRAGRTGIATLFITPRERRMMREIEGFTGSKIKPMKMPTSADVAAKRISVLKESIRKNIQEGDLEMYLELVEQLVDEGSFDVAEIAAAAARLANSTRPAAAEPVEQRPERVASESAGESIRTARPAPRRESSGERERPPRRDDSGEPKVRLSIAVGREDGIRPGDIVGSIANEADIPGRDIGPIDIRENITFVTVPEKYGEKVIQATASAKFRGRRLNVKLAGSEADTPERRPRKQEESYEDRPRRDAAVRRTRSDAAPRREGGYAARSDRPPRRDSGESFPERIRRAYSGRDAEPRFADRDRERSSGGFGGRGGRPSGGAPGRGASSSRFGGGGGGRFADRDRAPSTGRREFGGRSRDEAPRGAKGRDESRGSYAPRGERSTPFRKKTDDRPARGGARDDRGGKPPAKKGFYSSVAKKRKK